MTAYHAVGGILMVAGAAFSVLAAIGVVRFPSAMARMHAATKSASLGLALLSLGGGVASGQWQLVGTGALIAAFLFLTAPISGHMLGRAAYLAGQAGELAHDDLADAEYRPLELGTPTRDPFFAGRWAALVVVWMLLWRDVSLGSLVGGSVAASVVEVVHRGFPRTRRIAPVKLLGFFGYYLGQVVVSNLRVAWAVLTPGDWRIREAIVAVPLERRSYRVALLVANAVTYTPGTLSVDLGGDPLVLFIHVLQFESAEEVRDTVLELERRAAEALPERKAD